MKGFSLLTPMSCCMFFAIIVSCSSQLPLRPNVFNPEDPRREYTDERNVEVTYDGESETEGENAEISYAREKRINVGPFGVAYDTKEKLDADRSYVEDPREFRVPLGPFGTRLAKRVNTVSPFRY